MVAVIVSVKYRVDAVRNIFYRIIVCQIVIHNALAVRQILPQINKYSGSIGGYFRYTAPDLINASMNSNFQSFDFSRRRAGCQYYPDQ